MLFFNSLLIYIKDAIALIGILIIIIGAFKAFLNMLQNQKNNGDSISLIRYNFGTNIILGLEFMVAADIIDSVIEPDYYSLGLLALLVIIRTVLSYFLNTELEALSKHQKQIQN